MIHLLDAGVLITANNLYYPIDRVPEFWEWVVHHAAAGRIKIPLEVFEEIKEGPDEEGADLLFDWITDDAVKGALLLDGEVDPSLVARAVAEGYAADLTDSEVEQLGRDPFLIAHALVDSESRIVVTTEVSQPRKQRQNRKVPDVCRAFGLRAINTFELVRELDFSTSWRGQSVR